MSSASPAPKPVTAPAAGPPPRLRATTVSSARSGPVPGSGSRFTTVSWSTRATASSTGERIARLTVPPARSQKPHGVGLAEGLAGGLGDRLATAGAGRGLGFGGSTENLGFVLGGTATVPTTPRPGEATEGASRG